MSSIDPLVLPVDTTQAIKGSTDLDKLTASGERLETQFTKTGKATDGWQQNMRGVDAAMKSTADRAIELSQATQRIIDRYDPLGTKMRSLQSDMALLQREMGNSTTDAAIKSFQGLEAEIERTGKLMQTAGVAGFDEAAKAADRGAFATAGAKRELMVLGHEAMQGNFSRMPGSFMVLAERMDLTTMLMSPMTLGIIAIGAAAVGVMADIYKMSSAISEFNKSLALTGGYAGQTRDSIAAMAASIQTSSTGGISAANTALAQLAATGKFTGGEMDSVGRAVLKFSELSGKSSEDAIKQFEGMSKGVADWAAKSNESYHFLTGAQYDHIAALEKQGDKSLAVMETMRLMNASMDTHKEHLSVITMAYRGWGMIIDDVNGALRKMIFPTVGESFQTESAKLLAMKRQAQQEENSWGAGPAVKSGWDVKIKEQQTLVSNLAKTAFKEDLATQQKAAADSLAELGMAARRKDDLLSASARSNSQKEKDAVKEYLDGQTAMLKAGMKIDDDIEQANKLKYLHDSNNPDPKAKKAPKDRSDPYASEREAAQEWAKYLADFTKLTENAEAKTLGLSKAQEELVRYLSSGAYKTNTEDMRQMVLQKAYDAIATEQLNAANRAEAKDMADAAIERAKAYDATVKQTDALTKQLEKQQEHNATIGKTKEQLADLTLARMLEQAAQKDSLANLADEIDWTGQLSQQYREQAKLLRDLGKAAKDGEAVQMAADLSKTVEGSLKGALTAAFNGSQNPIQAFGNSLGKAVETSLISSIADAMTKKMMSSSAGTSLLSLFGFADGGAFSSGGVHAFADGGAFSNSVLTQPTPFLFANGGSFSQAVAGEAGPEAVMPLTRGSDGKLGVQATGGSGSASNATNVYVTQNFTVGDVASMSQVRQAVAGSEKRIQAGMGRSMNYGGALA